DASFSLVSHQYAARTATITIYGHARNGPRSRRARAASQPGSQHGDLGELVRRAVAVLGQPADVSQASQRPPCVDEVAVDVGAVAGEDVAEVLLVSEREDG